MIKKTILIILIIIIGVCFTLLAYQHRIAIYEQKTMRLDNKDESVEKHEIEIDERYTKHPSYEYMKLMKEYNKKHYGKKNVLLTNPQIIVVHTSACKTLEILVATLKPDRLGGRKDITKGGNVNVGVHFLIDKDGKIYSSIPLSFTGRHAIGLNYTAIGIENVGLSEKDYTEAQIDANKKLITMLTNKYKTIKYIIGHYEYNNTNMEHYTLIKKYDTNYRLPKRSDPGKKIMTKIRGY